MNDTVPPGSGVREALDALGIRIGVLLAGAAGGIVSLQYLKNLSRTETVLALFSSLALACYLTPVVVSGFGIDKQAYQFGCAFILGLCALHIIPAIRAAAPAITRWVITRFTGGSIQPTQGDGGNK